MTYFKQIDSFRFFAAFAVLVSHWLHFIPFIENLKLGFLGVDFFFVISGFLISSQLYSLRESINSKQISLKKAISEFFIKRVFRIFPLYYAVLLISTLFNKGEIRDAFFFNLTYTTNFHFIDIQKWPSIFSQFWSLSVEEHFYLVWPLIVLIIKRRYILLTTIIVIVVAILFRFISFTNSQDFFKVYIHTLSCLDLFMYGAILGYFFKWKKNKFYDVFSNSIFKSTVITCLILSYVSLLMFQYDHLVYAWVFFRCVFGIVSTCFVGLLVVGFNGWRKCIFENNYLVRGGKISYAIYLVHNFVPGILLEIKKIGLPIILEFSIYLIVTIIISELLFRFIETPFRRLGGLFKKT